MNRRDLFKTLVAPLLALVPKVDKPIGHWVETTTTANKVYRTYEWSRGWTNATVWQVNR